MKRPLKAALCALLLVITAALYGCAQPNASPRPTLAARPTMNLSTLYAPQVDMADGRTNRRITVFGQPEELTNTGVDLLADTSKLERFSATYQVEILYTGAVQGDAWQQLALLTATDTAPSVLLADASCLPTYAARGLVAPIDDYINPQDQNLCVQAADAYTYQGSRYAIQPRSMLTWRSLVYNATAFDAAGLQRPAERFFEDGQYTWAQLFEDSAALVNRDADGQVTTYGYKFTFEDLVEAVALCNTGLFARDEQGAYALRYDDAALAMLQQFEQAYAAGKIALFDAEQDSMAGLATGSVRILGGTWYQPITLPRQYATLANGTIKLQAVPVPTGEGVGEKLAACSNFYLLGQGDNADLAYYMCWYMAADQVDPAVATPVPRDEFYQQQDETVRYLYQYGDQVRNGTQSPLFWPDSVHINTGDTGFEQAFGQLTGQFVDQAFVQGQGCQAALQQLQPAFDQLFAEYSALAPVQPADQPAVLEEAITFDRRLFAVDAAPDLAGASVRWTDKGIEGGSLKALVDDAAGEGQPAVRLFGLQTQQFYLPAYHRYRVELTCQVLGDRLPEATLQVELYHGDQLCTQAQAALTAQEATRYTLELPFAVDQTDQQNYRIWVSVQAGEAVELLFDNITVSY